MVLGAAKERYMVQLEHVMEMSPSVERRDGQGKLVYVNNDCAKI